MRYRTMDLLLHRSNTRQNRRKDDAERVVVYQVANAGVAEAAVGEHYGFAKSADKWAVHMVG